MCASRGNLRFAALTEQSSFPWGSIPANLTSLGGDNEIICYGHHAMRSLDVARWLQGQGIRGAKSMAGGIDRWSVQIDPRVPRY
jgi:rhodanese-related sulfurtransferase